MGSGICGNLMCWQLAGEARVGWGVGIGFDQDGPSPTLPVPVGLLFPSVFLLPVFSYILGALGERGRRGGVFHLLSLWNCHLIGAPGPLSPPSFSVFPRPLSSFPLLLTWLTSSPTPPAGSWPGGQVPAEL